jgi:hypothetical protein
MQCIKVCKECGKTIASDEYEWHIRYGHGESAAEVENEDELTDADQLLAALEEDGRLPSTYRHGRGGDSDLTIDNEGGVCAVWKPDNPEDDYS